jgi:transcriptional regulator with XRE-family HTH domain
MTTFQFGDALRVARYLTGVSLREIERLTNFDRKTVAAAESDAATRSSTISELRKFYESQGIEFLGNLDLATGLSSGVGARWRKPELLSQTDEQLHSEHMEKNGVAFAAARGLLKKKQSEVARLSGLPVHKIQSLEAGTGKDLAAGEKLRDFYERENVEFLGWGDVSREVFYGVGVRWKPM